MTPFARKLWTLPLFLFYRHGSSFAFNPLSSRQFSSSSKCQNQWLSHEQCSNAVVYRKQVRTFPTKRHHPNKQFAPLFSSFASIDAPLPAQNNDDKDPSKLLLKKKNNKTYPINLVVVNRGRQSMAFRQGSQLVFSGAISNTLQIHLDSNNFESELELGSLVAVAVNRKGNNDNKNRRNNHGKNRYGKKNKNSEMISYPHSDLYMDSCGQLLDKNDADVTEDVNNLQIIGFGIYNPQSMYRVRILCHETSHPSTFKAVQQMISTSPSTCSEYTKKAMMLILGKKMAEAISSRESLGLPNESTDSYRLLNGEGDGLSGLAIDILGGKVAVLMSSAAWCEVYKEEIMQALKEVLELKSQSHDNALEFVWRTTESRLKQDGYNAKSNEKEEPAVHNFDRSVIATESGIQYELFPWAKGQKTGFYCDQRENRLQVAQLCNNKRVLDLCCYNGGFSLNAMKHGAKSCVGVDSSQDAIDAAILNAKINGLKCSFVRDDIAHFMKETSDQGDTYYDVIVLDPPKLAPSVSGLERASRKYQALNRDAIKLIDPIRGGLLLTCTCSGAMTQKEGGQFFLQTVKAASLSARRQITLLRTSGAASCHTQCPASFPAGAYLTAALFHVGPLER